MQDKLQYSVLIAEDEFLVRSGLRNAVDWRGHNMQIVAEACDGLAAWKLYRKYKPDIVVTDLRMPQMDGIQLIQKIRQQDDHCAIIVITCLEQFSTLREVMVYGISDYLVKATMHVADVENALNKAVANVGMPRPENYETGQAKKLHQLLEDYLMRQNISPRRLMHDLAQAGISIPEFHSMQICRFSRSRGMTSMLLNVLQGIICEYIGPSEIFTLSNNLLMILSQKRGREIETPYRRTIAYGKQHFDIEMVLLSHDISCPVDSWPSNMGEMLVLLDDAFLMDRAVVMLNEQSGLGDDEYMQFIKAVEEHAMLQYDMPMCAAIFNDLKRLAEPYERNQMMELLAALKNHLGVKTKPNGKDGIHHQLEDIINELTGRETPSVKRLHAVARYIMDHLQDDLSLTGTAEATGFQPQTLSLSLKRVTGIPYSGFVARHRILQSQAMLKRNDNSSMQQIADACGFADAAYFCRVFKHKTGYTPGEWKNI